MVCSGIDLNLRLGSLVVRVVFGAFCLGGGSWVREFVLLRFLRGWFSARTKRTEILYIFFGIHTANVLKLADRIEQRVSLSAA